MSIPPQLIRVKRKRVEEAPVTFLQFDEGQKRHRSGSNWAYQRRDPAASSARTVVTQSNRPVIHSSRPEDAPLSDPSDATVQRCDAVSSQLQSQASQDAEPRRFHIARSVLSATNVQTPLPKASRQKHNIPAIFVERSRKRKATSPRKEPPASLRRVQDSEDPSSQVPDAIVEERPLKRPGIAGKARITQDKGPAHVPLPPSMMTRHDEDMDKIAADMNRWVLNEIGANLHTMEEEKKQQAKSLRFKPKAPAQRYSERNPGGVPVAETKDVIMSDVSDDDTEDGDDDDWIIEEYVRIPANSVAMNVSPSDIGVLVLNDDEESMLFFGSSQDEDEDYDEDEDDENAENYYTADYPEDEIASDDEYGRHAYGYRNGGASDDEEFDKVYNSNDEEDKDPFAGDDDDDEAIRMARIRAYMKRNSAFP